VTVYSGTLTLQAKPLQKSNFTKINVLLCVIAGIFLFAGIYFVIATVSMQVSLNASRTELRQQQQDLSMREQEFSSSQALAQLRRRAESEGFVVAKEQDALYADLGVAMNEIKQLQN